jgi:prepilin-type N-terminal cleavage/methylation domain-containing protein
MNAFHHRRAVTLIEVTVATVLIAVLATVILQSQVLRIRLQRAMHWRELATIEAGNLMERMTALPWGELNQERLAALTLSDDFRQAVPKAALHVALDPAAEQPEGRRINIEIDWPGPVAEMVRPVRLTSWVYRIEPQPAVAAESKEGNAP